jgi:hypothetical protein
MDIPASGATFRVDRLGDTPVMLALAPYDVVHIEFPAGGGFVNLTAGGDHACDEAARPPDRSAQDGDAPVVAPPSPSRPEVRRYEERRSLWDKEDDQPRNAARELWFDANPALGGTPVDIYLRGQGVGLLDLPRLPGAIRFHPGVWHAGSGRKWPAMLAAVSRNSYRHQFPGVLCTWLEVTRDGVCAAPIEGNGAVLGHWDGGYVAIARGATNQPLSDMDPEEWLHITETVEDGLRLAAINHEARIIAAIGQANMGEIVLPTRCRKVKLHTNGGPNEAAMLAYTAEGRQVWGATC